MRAKIIRRWAILFATLGLIGGTGYAIQQFQVSRLARSVAEQADSALALGDLQKAEVLYAEHLKVVPNDVNIKLKYADVLLKVASTPARQESALQIYTGILKSLPGRLDVRRRLIDLKVAMGRFRDAGAEADLKILLNLPENAQDGHLLYLMGRCSEDAKSDTKARDWYTQAIRRNAPEKIECYQRLAILLRSPERLNDPKAADRAIEEMVASLPQNYLVYLARGRYRRQFGLPGGRADFEKALKLADKQPETYLELARIAEIEGGQAESRKVLEDGLTRLPDSGDLYLRLADLEQRTGKIDDAIATLQRALKSTAEKSSLHYFLANLLAIRGETGTLLLEIEELKRLGVAPVATDFLTGHYYVNTSDFRKAKQVLVPLESIPGLRADLKARVSNLLARCYSQLGEQGMQQEALLRALAANPQDMQAKLGLIDRMVKRGEIDEAIKEYRAIVKTVPRASLLLIQQLIAWNMRRPPAQRDWNEVDRTIEFARKNFPESVEPSILHAESLMARELRAEAREVLEKARAKFPKSVAIRCAQAEGLTAQKRFDEAGSVLEQAEKDLGDSVDLRLQRARLSIAKGGPEAVASLDGLSKNIEPFSKADRRKLLTGLAIEFVRLQLPENAVGLWSRLAEFEPNDIDLRLNLLDLAFQTSASREIEKAIKEIEQIEGSGGSLGPMCRVQYLIWQAERAFEKAPQEAQRLRAEARSLLSELVVRRPDWSAVPVALAHLEEQELRQARQTSGQESRPSGLSDREIQAKEESIVRSYRRAIDLGQRSSAIIRETVKLLFKLKRGSEAIDLINSIPVAPQLASDLGRQALSFAVENRDFERAEEIARKAIIAKPGDFQERIWLVQILLARGRQTDAERVMRAAVELSKSDPDRWIVLVQFLALTKQLDKAATVIKDAEAILPESQAPLALAQCCGLLGRAYEGNDEAQKIHWYALAKRWYEKALADHPGDLAIARRLTDFFVQTRQMSEVETHLEAILKQSSNSQSTETKAWARRTLAVALASSTDPDRVRRALAVLEPKGPAGATLQDPDDLRALARVLDAQRNLNDRKRAIEITESLITKNLASPDDRFFLARLEESSGNWPRALEIYRDLNIRTKNSRDLESLNRRSIYLGQFGRSLLRNHKSDDEQDLIEAQELVDEIALRQPDSLDTLSLKVDVCLARKRVDKAVDLIKITANRPNLTPIALKTLAALAEKLDLYDLADQLFRQYSDLPNTPDGSMSLAMFLGRRGRIKEALDRFEPFWAQAKDPEAVASACVQVMSASNDPPDPAQVDRVAVCLEQALQRKKDSTFLLLTLANYREQQKRYDDAKALYRLVVEKLSQATQKIAGNSVTPYNQNTMLAMSFNNLAWLIALKDGQGKEALEYINQAIKLMGPQPDFLDTRGVIYLILKQTDNAVLELENAVKRAPSASKMFHLAQAYYQANNKEKAKQVLKDATAKGLDSVRVGPGALHALELPAYQRLLTELGM